MDQREIQHSREYQTLLNNIPGGVQQCLNDDAFTLVEINQGFIDLFGFSRQELQARFEDRFIDLIHPSDRERVLAETAGQLKHGQKATFQYRVRCRDGSCKWVMDNAQLIRDANGGERIFRVLLDVTEARNAREELRLSLELHQIIMDQAADILFVWNFASDTMTYSSNWVKKFGYPPVYHGLAHRDTVFRHIHPEDASSLAAIMAAAKNGNAFSTAEARIQNAEGTYVWCRFRATDQYDEAGTPMRAVGVITDIDREKRIIENLKKRAEMDALTGLYNRAETEERIRQYLAGQPEELCALLMIDVDNFKAVNDGLGHLLGDAVLTELAAGMKKLTRRSDVVGRIGGDEFTIFLKDIPSVKTAREKAEQLGQLFRSLFRNEKQPVEVTCSIGMAVYPQDGMNFPTLYHSADLALYQAKNLGKNQVALYDFKAESPMDPAGRSALGAAIDSDRRTACVPGDLTNYVFQTLYDAGDFDQAAGLILEIVGKRFDVSRAYIFENSEDGKYTRNTYEWCGEGIRPEKETLQQCSLANAIDYKELFKENAVFYCRDIQSLPPVLADFFAAQGIRSTLQCAMYYGTVFSGFIGFDECTGTRMWTKEETGALSIISKMLAIFLQRRRIADHDRQLADRLMTVDKTQKQNGVAGTVHPLQGNRENAGIQNRGGFPEKRNAINEKKTILVVEDQEINREILCQILSEEYEVLQAENGQEALDVLHIHGEEVSIILLDITMPVMDGYAFLSIIKTAPAYSAIPVIVTTQSDGDADEVAALSHGATDFVAKPYKPQIIRHRVASLINLSSLQKTAAMVSLFQIDSLTGLFSKEYFYQRVRETLAQYPDRNFDLICSNIENFKLINDAFGVPAADKFLRGFAELLQKRMQGLGVCGRLSADRFACLIERRREYTDKLFKEDLEYINAMSEIKNIVVRWGIYPVAENPASVEQMCDRALLTAESIKGQYGTYYAVYDDTLRRQLQHRQQITDCMEAALAEKQFQIYLQPKYRVRDGALIGAEALVRWLHPQWGLQPPSEFIPLFEKNGFITKLDRYVWDTACALMREWEDKGIPPLSLSVNVSRADIFHADLAEVLLEIVNRHGLRPERLHLEITESAYAEALDRIVETTGRLRALGFAVEMDDFGSGYSSLNILSKLPVDILKLDMKFLQSEIKETANEGILQFIMSLARYMKLGVVAEGVETEEQFHFLQEIGCDCVQGYYFARPMPVNEFEVLMENALTEGYSGETAGVCT